MVTWLNDENALQVYDGTAWNGLAASGGNAIINGAFEINQRGFSSTTLPDTFGFDRWFQQHAGGTTTMSAQTFTAGTAPVQGYEARNFIRQQTTGQSAAGDYAYLLQRIESVRSFANQTVTVSFWAKAASGTPKVTVEATQLFGSGGSPSSLVRNYLGQVTISTSWARYSVTASIASIAGKTLGTANDDWLGIYLWTSAGSDFNSRTNSMGIQNNTFDIWGVQLEAGPTANVFRRNANSLQGELAACQRYYWRTSNTTLFSTHGNGSAYSTTAALINIINPVPMRAVASSVDYGNLRLDDNVSGFTFTSLTLNSIVLSSTLTNLNVTGASGLTQFRFHNLSNNNNTAGFIGFSAEL
jgi:hypothetical protein